MSRNQPTFLSGNFTKGGWIQGAGVIEIFKNCTVLALVVQVSNYLKVTELFAYHDRVL